MLNRKYDKKIQEFLLAEKAKSVLLIDGVRQCGKSTSVRENVRKLELPLVEINFRFHPEYISLLKKAKDAKSLIDLIRLNLESGFFIENKTIIFFDEIQLYPELLEKAKMLV